jgi:hypothetical protein
MKKPQYALERDERVRNIQEHFESLGIPILAQEVRDVFSKKEKCKGKTIESDNEYDPSSDIDNQSDSDDDYDDDLNNEDNTEVRCITRPIIKYLVSLFQSCTSLYSFNVLHTCSLIDKMHVSLGR